MIEQTQARCGNSSGCNLIGFKVNGKIFFMAIHEYWKDKSLFGEKPRLVRDSNIEGNRKII